jgi:hypothetical protein
MGGRILIALMFMGLVVTCGLAGAQIGADDASSSALTTGYLTDHGTLVVARMWGSAWLIPPWDPAKLHHFDLKFVSSDEAVTWYKVPGPRPIYFAMDRRCDVAGRAWVWLYYKDGKRQAHWFSYYAKVVDYVVPAPPTGAGVPALPTPADPDPAAPGDLGAPAPTDPLAQPPDVSPSKPGTLIPNDGAPQPAPLPNDLNLSRDPPPLFDTPAGSVEPSPPAVNSELELSDPVDRAPSVDDATPPPPPTDANGAVSPPPTDTNPPTVVPAPSSTDDGI